MNLHDLLEISARREPAKVALRFQAVGDEPSFEATYADLLAGAERLASALAARGVAPGDRIALFLGNGPALVAAVLAAFRLGAVVVPINLAYRRREVAHILGDAQPRLLVAERELLPVLDELERAERGGVEVILAEELASLVPGPDGAALPASEGDALAAILYTSGTTGRSKGAMLTHGNLLATITGLLFAWAWERADVLLLTLPLFHVHGLVVGLLTALAAGARVELRRRFDADAVAAELAAGNSGGATVFFGVPTMYVRLVDALRQLPDRSALGRMRLFCSGSAPLAPETFAAFRELAGHDILERYGMTEAGMILSNPYAGPRLPGTVGRPLPGVSARIVDAELHDLPSGEEGELLVAGGNVFAGYWGNPEATAAAFLTDGAGRRWLKTGDLARRDPASGHIALLGRRGDLVITGGFNVYPREVEEVLAAFPGVAEAAVVGRPDPEWGEVPVAFVVADGEVDEAALTAHLKEGLAGFKVPRAIHRVAVLPRNALGKVQRHLLRE